ncbi:hypothetical protein WVIC16_110162 [Weissella viridescens]|nr:hypothetical protein WVIC16_110162 [Weissella viridescens]
MNIWNDMYEQAKTLYNPRNISPFIYGGQVVCAIESIDDQIYTGVCIEFSGDFYRLIFVQIKNRQRKADGFLLWTRWGSNPQSLG